MQEDVEQMWDAVVVGAGPAGSAAAYDLALAGRKVLLLDRAEFPRTKACAGGLTRTALRALRYSVEPVTRLRCDEMVLEDGQGKPVRVAGPKLECVMTLREELDSFCLAKTLERGAEFRRVGGIAGFVTDKDGLTLTLTGGETLRTRYLVGADGVHSRVRALLGDASWFRSGFALEANVAYRKGESYPLIFDFATPPNGYGWLFPRDNHVNVGLGVFVTVAEGAERLDRKALDRYIVERCGPDREVSPTVGQFLGMGGEDYTPKVDTRVLLVGDAGGFVNTLTGEGISGAVLSGQAAAFAIHAALGGSPDVWPRSEMLRSVPACTPAGTGFLEASYELRKKLRSGQRKAGSFYRDPSPVFRLLRFPGIAALLLRGRRGAAVLDVLSRGFRRVFATGTNRVSV